MTKTPWSTSLALAAVIVQTCASLLLFGGPPGDPSRLAAAGLGAGAALALPINTAALVVAVLRVRRRRPPGPVLVALSVLFLLWHGFALGLLAGWWSSGLHLAAYIAGSTSVSVAYQAFMCGAFAAVVASEVLRRTPVLSR